MQAADFLIYLSRARRSGINLSQPRNQIKDDSLFFREVLLSACRERKTVGNHIDKLPISLLEICQ